jgi:hypothetical protein
VELARRSGNDQSGSLTVAAISAVFTIGYVAKLLGEDEDWLHELSISMFAEDGRLTRLRYWRRRRHGLHAIRDRLPEADHRRRKSRGKSTKTRPFGRITSPAVLTEC